jgi:hypothetical protein
VEEYIECRHSQNGLSRERMAPKEVEAFDRALRDLLDDLQRQGTITAHDGRLDLEVDARVVWGKPCP